MSKTRKPSECDFVAVARCPCGKMVAVCMKHLALSHEDPECRQYRTMERDAYLDYVTREWARIMFEETDPENLPRV